MAVIKLLIPDMPSAEEVLPFLRKMDETKVYVNGGPLVCALESILERVCAGPATVVSNATVGLELALRALNLAPGSRVLVPAVTYVASGLAICNAGLVPVLADVDAKTWQLSPADVFDAMNAWPEPNIAAVMPVAAFGALVPIEAWGIFAANTGIPVVIDAAGMLTEQEVIQNPLVTVVYSMHATKFFGCGEGGVVACVDAQRVQRIREMACFGPGGTNAKMSEYHAGVAMAQFRRLEAKHSRTMMVYDAYALALPDVLLDSAQEVIKAVGNHTLMPVLLPEWCGAGPAAEFLKRRGAETRQWYRPFLNELPGFSGFERPAAMPVTDMLADRLLGLPFHTSLQSAEIEIVCDALIELLATNG